MSEPLIRVRDLAIGWDRSVLQRDLSFDVEEHDIFVILGGSGSGKSTLLRHLIGLEQPLTGSVHIRCEEREAAKTEMPRFGVMFQSGALLGSRTVGQNLALPLETWTYLPSEAVDAIVRAKLRVVGLEGVEEKMPSELSGGMKKRAAIARAMVLEPSLLFLDEPSAGLDPVTAAELDELILSLNGRLGITLVIITHELESILKLGKHCIMLDREAKGIIARGAPRELRDHSTDRRVRAFFTRRVLEAS